MRYLIIHFVICTALFSDYFSHQSLYLKKFYRYQASPFSKLKIPIKPKKHQDFLKALLTGNKRSLKKHKEYKQIQVSNMLHLLTPSGLHLSALTLPFYLVFKSKLIRLTLLAILSFLLFSIPGLEAAKRILAFKSTLIFSRSVKPCFLGVFSLAYLFNPSLSFLLSYFFIGVILFNPTKRLIPTLGLFAAAQILVCVFFNTVYFPLSILINPLGSLFISLSFPLLFITAFLPSFYQYSGYYLVELFLNFSELIYKIPPLFRSNLLSVLFVLLFIFSRRWKMKFLCLTLLVYRPLISI